MKVLSLLQPWATLVVIGAKKIETRSWNTSYRGEILIHASLGKSIKTITGKHSCRQIAMLPHFHECIDGMRGYDRLPFGAIIGKVTINHVLTSEQISNMEVFRYRSSKTWNITEQEKAFGDYSPDRYGWLLSDPVQFATPTPAKGSLKLWDFDEGLLLK